MGGYGGCARGPVRPSLTALPSVPPPRSALANAAAAGEYFHDRPGGVYEMGWLNRDGSQQVEIYQNGKLVYSGLPNAQATSKPGNMVSCGGKLGIHALQPHCVPRGWDCLRCLRRAVPRHAAACAERRPPLCWPRVCLPRLCQGLSDEEVAMLADIAG